MSNVTCTRFPHPGDCDTVNIVRRVFGAISCLSCIFVIFVIWLFRRYSVLAQRLILFLTIAALFDGLGRVFQHLENATNDDSAWCIFQAFWLSYFNYAVMLWVLCITFNLFLNVIRNITTSKFEKWYHVVSWGVSLAFSLLLFIGSHYGPSGSWCWIVNDSAWLTSVWYVPLFVIILLLLIIYGYIVTTMRKKANNWTRTYNHENRQAQASLKEEIKTLRLYPFMFLLLSVFPLVNRIHHATTDGHHVLALVLLHAISASMQGAVYALVFAMDRDTLRSLTYKQMKAQLLKKFAPPLVVQEYPLGECDTERTRQDGTQEARY